MTKNENNKYKKATIWLIVTQSITAFLLVVSAVFCAVSFNQSMLYGQALESNYQKNFFELVDNINNAETKLSKVVVSNDSDYTKNLLLEVSKNTARASSNISALPFSINGLSDAITFVNRVDGFTSSLAKKLENGEELTASEKEDISNVYNSLKSIKSSLGEMSNKLYSGYSILDESLKIEGDYNNLTATITSISTEVDYPTMIYDGPFSESVLNAEVKGLTGTDISKDDAKNKLIELFNNVREEDVIFQSESGGKFNTFDFNIKTTTNQSLFVQMTKKGGKVLTISSYSNSTSRAISLEQAKNIAVDFAKKMEIESIDCIWSDLVGNYGIFNLAPIINNTIIYPDLIKVKIDLTEGNIIGYDATTYYTNHISRTISSPTIGATIARDKILSSFEIETQKLALSPLDYNREVLCYEFKCKKDNSTYYIYINADTGKEENILKVVETSKNGNLII